MMPAAHQIDLCLYRRSKNRLYLCHRSKNRLFPVHDLLLFLLVHHGRHPDPHDLFRLDLVPPVLSVLAPFLVA
jgi:hypothetical protein